MLSGIIFLAGVVLLALGIRWISNQNNPVYKKTDDHVDSLPVSKADDPKNKK
jgi:hypothetical protein